MTRRLAILAASTIAFVGGFGASQAQAEPDLDVPVTSLSSEDYWACVALDYVEVGACVGNVFPDPTEYGTLPGIIGGVVDGLPA